MQDSKIACVPRFRNFRPYWSNPANGVGEPVIDKGSIAVPAGPSLPIAWSEEAGKEYLGDGGWFAPAGE